MGFDKILREIESYTPNAKVMRKTHEKHGPEHFADISSEQWDEWESNPEYICIFCMKPVSKYFCPLCREYKGVVPYFECVEY